MDNKNIAESLCEVKNTIYNVAGCCRAILQISGDAMEEEGKPLQEKLLAIDGIADILVDLLYETADKLDRLETETRQGE